jgi:hypothetical protein
MTKPTYQEEVQFVAYSDSSRNGARVTFRLPDRDLLEHFIGQDGKRFMMVLVEIGADEQPVEPAPVARPRGGRLAKEAGIMCANKAFHRQVEAFFPTQWGKAMLDCDGDPVAAAAHVIRKVCGVLSRADLDHSADAADNFQRCFRKRWIASEAGVDLG